MGPSRALKAGSVLFLCAKLCRDSDSAMLRPKGQVAAVGQVKLGVTQVLPTAVLNPNTTFCPAALHLAGSSTSGQRPQPSSLAASPRSNKRLSSDMVAAGARSSRIASQGRAHWLPQASRRRSRWSTTWPTLKLPPPIPLAGTPPLT